jgi:hypothetical protein
MNMKPLHVGLLVAGAAVAGALAVKMTEPPALPPPVNHAPGEAKKSTAGPSAKTPQQKPATDAISQSVVKKTSLVPVTQTAIFAPGAGRAKTALASASVPTSRAGTAETDTSAPPPIYSEPRHTKPTPFTAPQPPQQKVETASATVPAPTLTPRPVPYHQPEAPATDQTAQLVEQVEEPHAPRQVTLEPGMILSIRIMEKL